MGIISLMSPYGFHPVGISTQDVPGLLLIDRTRRTDPALRVVFIPCVIQPQLVEVSNVFLVDCLAFDLVVHCMIPSSIPSRGCGGGHPGHSTRCPASFGIGQEPTCS
jgi:hypothetical protein